MQPRRRGSGDAVLDAFLRSTDEAWTTFSRAGIGIKGAAVGESRGPGLPGQGVSVDPEPWGAGAEPTEEPGSLAGGAGGRVGALLCHEPRGAPGATSDAGTAAGRAAAPGTERAGRAGPAEERGEEGDAHGARGLDRNLGHTLKAVCKGAATTVIVRGKPWAAEPPAKGWFPLSSGEQTGCDRTRSLVPPGEIATPEPSTSPRRRPHRAAEITNAGRQYQNGQRVGEVRLDGLPHGSPMEGMYMAFPARRGKERRWFGLCKPRQLGGGEGPGEPGLPSSIRSEIAPS